MSRSSLVGRILRGLLWRVFFVSLLFQTEGCGVRFGPNEPPSRPQTVPATAFWLSGRELTGVWVDIRSAEADAFTADVYFESGQLWMSDRFVAPPNQFSKPITIEWLRKHIAAPDGDAITVIDDGKEILFRGKPHSSPEPY